MNRCLLLMAGLVIGGRVCMADGALKPFGQGVQFDGESAFTVPVAALELDERTLTVSIWVKVNDVKKSQVFLNTGEASNGFTFYLYNDHVRMLIGRKEGPYLYATAAPPAPGVWTHYAGSYDGETIKVYRNGELSEARPAPGVIYPITGNLFIGALNEHERFLHGDIREVCIWRRALTDSEVQLAASGFGLGIRDKDLAARWTPDYLARERWKPQTPGAPTATRIRRQQPDVLINGQDEGYRGIWYSNQPSHDEYVYKYSGGLGTYCAKHIPHAWYVEKVNKTFFTYGGTTADSNTRLIHMVSYFDHNTGTVPRPTILLDKKTSDAHDNPVINVDSAGYIWIFSSSHGTARPSYISRSKKPYSIDEFELVWTGNFSYPQPWYLPGRGFLFMHTYYQGGRTICMMTSPDGVRWSERRLLSRIHQGHYQISRPLSGGRVGSAFNYHPNGKGLNWRTNLYYMESSDFGRTWQTAGGRELTLPLADPDNPALVHDYQEEKLNVYMKDITCDAKGRPIILFVTSKGYESGPENMPRTWTTARWTGSSWEIRGGDIISDNNYDTGSLYIEADDQWRIIGPTQTGPQPYNPGGEVAMWISRDQGANWTMIRQMTSGSDYNHTYVRRPVNAHPDFYAFWADGHGRKPSDSRLYFCNRQGDVFRLPVKMTADHEKPVRIEK